MKYFNLIIAVFSLLIAAPTQAQNETERERVNKLYNEGNYSDALEGYKKLFTSPAAEDREIVLEIGKAVICLNNLGRTTELDPFLEDLITKNDKNWRVLYGAAQSYHSAQHQGMLIGGKFSRSNYGEHGKYVNSQERDRVRVLQLLLNAIELSKNDPDTSRRSEIYHYLGDVFARGRNAYEVWKLQQKTDLQKLPDYDDYYTPSYSGGAPANKNGEPVFFVVPDTLDAAKNDGERARFAYQMELELNPSAKDRVEFEFAQFLQAQFGVETIMGGMYRGYGNNNSYIDKYNFQALKDEETIARIGDEIKKITLPDEFNPLKLFQKIIDGDNNSYREQAFDQQCTNFENRRQFIRAAECWRKYISIFGDSRKNKQKKLDQIIGAWGMLEPSETLAANSKNSLQYQFRNGTSVALTAQAIDTESLLQDIKSYLRDNPKNLDYNKLTPERIGYSLVNGDATKYLREVVAKWSQELKPKADHFDKKVDIDLPFKQAGAYLVTATIAGGNKSEVVLWIADSAIIKKPLSADLKSKQLFYLGDASNGAPIAQADVEFFGYKNVPIEDRTLVNKFSGGVSNIITTEFKSKSESNGIVSAELLDNQYTWLISAKDKSGRKAFLGFTNVWSSRWYDQEYYSQKTFVITDRPVYRPSQNVKFKIWIGTAKYDQGDNSLYANQAVEVQVNKPNGEKFYSKSFTTDSFGGVQGEFVLPVEASLGVYSIGVVSLGMTGTFRVEEYKKPEFEVTVEAPKEPIKLGDKFTAKVSAKYYFGAPVSEGRVKYKVMRSGFDSVWYPPSPWDWLYGVGYWWFSYDLSWYPGWLNWGCKRPIPWWWNRSSAPPELVIEREVSLSKDGTAEIAIDSTLAKEIHGDEDQKYQITAEVVDNSRRTIVGTGEVIAARKPFKIYAWGDKGYYHTGDEVKVYLQARTIDGKPVEGKGTVKLLQVRYQNEKINEHVLQTIERNTDQSGAAEVDFRADKSGQYRVSYNVTDKNNEVIEGGYLFTVWGEENNNSKGDFRFSDLELVPEKRDYKPGENLRLAINTNIPDSTVLLFLRPVNGIYLDPEIITLEGKGAIREIPITAKDMPNFFVEAVVIAHGKVFTEVREIIVPPEQRILSLTTTPSKESYKPGEKTHLTLQLKDEAGKPFVGSIALSVYDNALEYISGGSNVSDIKEFFWKWRRNHQAVTESSLDRIGELLYRPNMSTMQQIGVLGGLVHLPVEQIAKDSELDDVNSNAPLLRQKSLAALASAPTEAPTSNQALPQIRKEFADTAFWSGEIVTNEKGEAEVEFNAPENLTEWKIKAWAIGKGTRVGEGESKFTTSKDLLVRLQAPRFLVEKDEVVISGNIHNYLKTARNVKAKLEVNQNFLQLLEDQNKDLIVPQNGEQRVDFRVKVLKEGSAKIRIYALTDEESDAMELTIPVYVHGIEKTESFSGALNREQSSGKLSFTIPEARRPEQTKLEIGYSPSIAISLVEALPYLADYPYGCTEQTLNKFLPTAIVQQTLKKLNIKIPPNTENLDEAKVKDMTRAGLDRLAAMQMSDGGWGWFSGSGESSWPHTTAYVVLGLSIAKSAGVELDQEVFNRGISWLKNFQAEELQKLKNADSKTDPYKSTADELDAFVEMILGENGSINKQMEDFLYRDKKDLSVYGKIILGLALEKSGQHQQLKEVLKNIAQYLVIDDENQTAYLKLPESNYWWFWYGDKSETQSYYLKLLSRTDPKGATTAKLAKYLINNRKHRTYWNSTRDTATAIEALSEFLVASGENAANLQIKVMIDGKVIKEIKLSPENLFSFDHKVTLQGAELSAGKHQIEFVKTGSSPLYYNAYLTNFTLEDPITKAGLEVKVDRNYFRLTRNDEKTVVAGARGQVVEIGTDKYFREQVTNQTNLKSEDLIEVELVIDSKNNYEYLMFEDFKPAGFEPVEVRSGYTGNTLGAYVEWRDNRTTLFVRELPQGKSSVTYRMRAEIPGIFSALPAKATAMYAPELRGNSDESNVRIEEK
jgi:uncharacterized protein YfaS (alpha-2-macroglobulin family)